MAHKKYVTLTELTFQAIVRKFRSFVNLKWKQAGIPNELDYNGLNVTTGTKIMYLFADNFIAIYFTQSDLSKLAIPIDNNDIVASMISLLS